MRIALPVQDNGRLLSHFGDATAFALYDVHDETRAITPLGLRQVEDPQGCHSLPPALKSWGVELVIAGEVGKPAINDLLLYGILAVTGAPDETADQIICLLVTGRLLAHHPACTADADAGAHACGHCTHRH